MTRTPARRRTASRSLRTLSPLALLAALLLPSAPGARAPQRFGVDVASNGFGLLLPHRVRELDAAGDPTAKVLRIRRTSDLFANVTPTNPVLPNATWPATALLPNGTDGNHFVFVRFTESLQLSSVLQPLASAAALDSLTGTIVVLAHDPATGAVERVRGQAFVGGKTYGSPDPQSPGLLALERWVVADPGDADQDGNLLEPAAIGGGTPGLGFPGTQSGVPVPQAAILLSDAVFLFVADTDDDLSTHETFPAGVQIEVRIQPGVLGRSGAALDVGAAASSVVGRDDEVEPELAVSPLSLLPDLVPGPGDINVDPAVEVELHFTEPVQPLSVGPFPGAGPPGPSAAVQLVFGPPSQTTLVPFTVRPVSPYDLTRYLLDPVFDFPGATPGGPDCGPFNQVRVDVSAGTLTDLTGNPNGQAASSFFCTGPGTGLVNAPVTPDAVYVGRGSATASVSTIDLNGFGAGTGDPSYDPLDPVAPGSSNYPNNPNARLQGSALIPPLAPQGSSTVDGGSAGVFTLTRDSNLDDRLVRSPAVQSVDDIMLGRPLDTVFNNAPPPFGCQAGGGSLCASPGLKLISVEQGAPNTVQPAGPFSGAISPGQGNLASWAPHPNPPPLVFPPTCIAPSIGGQEPTSVDTLAANLLGPSANFLGDPSMGVPPAGTPAREQNAFFAGPSAPAPSVALCSSYQLRQQIGFFLYVCDRAAGEVVVLDSNRYTVLDRIVLDDPTSFAMSPDVDFLAVSSRAAGTVSFIDVDPASSSFHQVVKTTAVGAGPSGLAWDPGNEDVLVCNEDDGTVSVLSAASLAVRKTLTGFDRPFEVAVTQRQDGFGADRGVYYAFVLGRDGTLSLFESGPDGVAGWGYDAVIGSAPFAFAAPRAIAADPVDLRGAVWIAHEEPLDPVTGLPTGQPGGALTKLFLDATVTGPILLGPPPVTPQLRAMDFALAASIGEDQLTGVPSDIAFDDLTNLAGLPNVRSAFGAGSPLPANGKSQVKPDGSGGVQNANEPSWLFAAVPSSTEGPGVVDVIDLAGTLERVDTDPFQDGVQSIPAPGAERVASYFRQ